MELKDADEPVSSLNDAVKTKLHHTYDSVNACPRTPMQGEPLNAVRSYPTGHWGRGEGAHSERG